MSRTIECVHADCEHCTSSLCDCPCHEGPVQVFVLLHEVAYEGRTLLGVHQTLQGAQDAAPGAHGPFRPGEQPEEWECNTDDGDWYIVRICELQP